MKMFFEEVLLVLFELVVVFLIKEYVECIV